MTDKEAEDLFGCIAGIIFVPVNIVVGCFVDGFVLARLWLWFIIPVFPSVHPLGMIQAIGIGLVAGYLTHQVIPSKDGETIWAVIGRGIVSSVALPLWVLMIGYIIYRLA